MPELSPLGRAALDYAARGWHVFPLKPNSKDPLIPARMGGRGFWDATTDPDRITRWWTVTPDANIGLGLVQSGLVCIDADTYKPGCEWSAFIAGRDLPDTLIQRSARGGTHYLFHAPKGADFPGSLCHLVDVKHKGYILLEPSAFEDGAYQWQTDDDPAPAPDWLLNAAPPVRTAAVPNPGARLAEDGRIRAYCDKAISEELASVAAAEPGTRNNTLNAAAFAIGQIVEAGYADRADMEAALVSATAGWDNHAKTIGTIRSGLDGGAAHPRTFPMEDEPPFDPVAAQAMAEAMWQAFERKDMDAAKAAREELQAELAKGGEVRPIWDAAIPKFSAPRHRGDVRAVRMNPAEFATIVPEDAPPFPLGNYRSDIPGLLGMLADYLDCASATSTDAGALAVAIPLLGAVMGRAYASPTDLRTNVYTVAIGGSGTGKTSLVNPAKEILTLAKAQAFLGGDDFASGSGLLKMLTAGPKISFLDEFGHTLQQISAPGAGIHSRQILTEFTKLYSSANTVFMGKEAATVPTYQIDCPHLCLFGMATPQQFWDAFGSGNLEDGSVARYLVFPIGEAFPKEPDKTGQGEIAEAIGNIVGHISDRAINSLSTPCRTVGMASEATRARASLVQMMDAAAICAEDIGRRGAPAILRRVAENATKIALISAVGRNHASPEINAHDFAIGRALAQWSAILMINNIASRIADNQTERDVNLVERKISEAGPDGILKWILFDKLRSIRKRDRDDILAGLIEAGKVVLINEPTSTRPRPILRHVRHMPLEG